MGEEFARPANFLIYEFLTNGGSRAMNVDGTTPVTFKYTPTVDVQLHSVHTHLVDTGISADDFGGISALANGVLIQVLDTEAAVIQHFGTDLHPIQQNFDFAVYAGDKISRDFAGGGDDVYIFDWDFNHAGAELTLLAGQTFQFIIQDDLQALTEFTVMLQGFSHGPLA